MGRYSNPDVRSLGDALAFFAKAEVTEKSVAQLEALVDLLQSSNVERSAEQTRVRQPSAARKLGSKGVRSLIEAYESGSTIKQVAEQFELSPSAVQRLLHNHGVKPRLAPLPAAVIARATKLYASGIGVQAIADEIGVPKSTMYRAMKRAALSMRPPSNSH